MCNRTNFSEVRRIERTVSKNIIGNQLINNGSQFIFMSNSFDRSIAVVIGINEYQNGIEPLQTPVSDAIAIATRLRDNYQYQFIHPSFESGVIVNQFATKDQLETLFKDILPNKIQPTQRDHLLFYFAGHGIARNSDGKLQGFLIPQDGNIKQQDSLLRMIDLHDWLSQFCQVVTKD